MVHLSDRLYSKRCGQICVKQEQYAMQKRDLLAASCLHSLYAIESCLQNIYDMMYGSNP